MFLSAVSPGLGVLVRNLRTVRVVYGVNVSEFSCQLTDIVLDKEPLNAGCL